ncbi:glycoside hydrolase family 3 protein [Vibrio rotiferianus]|uniref:glycoside hydrolase family 3 protein n=1 Tax=Vibrio rotiferianus TaxID=190895 RepID=UPI00406A6022
MNLKSSPFFLNDEDIQWVNETLGNMTLEEKIGHLFCPIGFSSDYQDLDNLISKYKPAGIMFRPGTTDEVRSVHTYLQENSKVPMLIAANLESGGNGTTVEGTEFASQMQVAATDDLQMAKNLGYVVAKEGAAAGCNWAFAPVIDLDINPHNPITNIRTYGSDVNRVAEMGAAYVSQVQELGLATSIKHFPGDGIDYRDQHLVLSSNTLSPQEWDESFGYVYQKAIDAGALTVMAGHIAMPKYSKQLNPDLSDNQIMPASLSKELLNDLLRDKLGFNGMVVTDATNMVGFTSVMKREYAVPLAIEAGCDLFLFNKDLDEDYGYMRKGIESGLLSMQRVDEAIMRTLATKASLKLHTKQPSQLPEKSVIGCEQHKQMAKECADLSITLAKDLSTTLPLTLEKHRRILLIALGGEGDMFGLQKGAAANLKSRLENEGFDVTVYDTSEFTMRDIMQPVSSFTEHYDLVLYAAELKTASNRTTLRINWARPMGIDAPWFSQEIPTMFISFGSPYHLMDVPRIPTLINAYTANDSTIEAVVNKILGRSEFKGISPVDVHVGQWDTYL